jgi:hypothetical protein
MKKCIFLFLFTTLATTLPLNGLKRILELIQSGELYPVPEVSPLWEADKRFLPDARIREIIREEIGKELEKIMQRTYAKKNPPKNVKVEPFSRDKYYESVNKITLAIKKSDEITVELARAIVDTVAFIKEYLRAFNLYKHGVYRHAIKRILLHAKERGIRKTLSPKASDQPKEIKEKRKTLKGLLKFFREFGIAEQPKKKTPIIRFLNLGKPTVQIQSDHPLYKIYAKDLKGKTGSTRDKIFFEKTKNFLETLQRRITLEQTLMSIAILYEVIKKRGFTTAKKMPPVGPTTYEDVINIFKKLISLSMRISRDGKIKNNFFLYSALKNIISLAEENKKSPRKKEKGTALSKIKMKQEERETLNDIFKALELRPQKK